MPTTWWRPTGRRTAPDSPRSGAWVRQPTPSSRCGGVTPTEPGCGWSPTASWEPTQRSTGNAAFRFADRDLDDVDRLRWHIQRLVTGSAGTVALGVAALDHEALNGSVEGQAVEEVVPRQEHDAAHRVRRKLLVELEDERATGRLDRRRVGGAGLEDVL